MYIETVIQPEVADIICNSEVSVVTYSKNNTCTGIIRNQNDKSELFRLDINGETTDQMSLALTSLLKTVYSYVNSGSWEGGPIEIRLDTATSVKEALAHDGVKFIEDKL